MKSALRAEESAWDMPKTGEEKENETRVHEPCLILHATCSFAVCRPRSRAPKMRLRTRATPPLCRCQRHYRHARFIRHCCRRRRRAADASRHYAITMHATVYACRRCPRHLSHYYYEGYAAYAMLLPYCCLETRCLKRLKDYWKRNAKEKRDILFENERNDIKEKERALSLWFDDMQRAKREDIAKDETHQNAQRLFTNQLFMLMLLYPRWCAIS